MGLNAVLLILYGLFSFVSAEFARAQFALSQPIVAFLCWGLVFAALAPRLMRRLSALELRPDPAREQWAVWPLYAIPIGVLALWYLVYYPGGLSPDSINQYSQVLSGSYNDWHPVAQTLFAFWLPLRLTGGWAGSVTLFQILLFGLALGYGFHSLYLCAGRRLTEAAMLFVLLNPQTCNIAMFPWKDLSFGIGALFLTAFSLRILMSRGRWLKKPLNLLLCALMLALTTLFRHNGILFTAFVVLALFFSAPKKQTLLAAVLAIALVLGVKGPLYSAIGVESPGSRSSETLGVPMAVIGGLTANCPEQMDPEVLEFAYAVAPKEVWEQRYVFGNYNNVKWDERAHVEVIEQYGTVRVLGMMLRCFRDSPTIAMRSLVGLTGASYAVSGNFQYEFFTPYIVENDLGLRQSPGGPIRSLFQGYTAFVGQAFPHLFLYLGLLHLVLMVAALSKCPLNTWRGWRRVFFLFPLFAYNFGSTLLLARTQDVSRFFYYSYPLLPLLLAIVFYREENAAASEPAAEERK